MDGLMMDTPLSLVHLFDRATKLHASKEIVTASPAGRSRLSYGEWGERTRLLGGVLDDLGISADGRVATFAWTPHATSSSTSPRRAPAGCRTHST